MSFASSNLKRIPLSSTRLFASRVTYRHASSKITPPRPVSVENAEPADPRPTWLFPLTRILNYAVIPATFVYAVFFHDFGDRDHVFMPARKWLDRQRAEFFSLSDAEQEIVGVPSEAPGQGTEVRQDR